MKLDDFIKSLNEYKELYGNINIEFNTFDCGDLQPEFFCIEEINKQSKKRILKVELT